MKTRYVWKLVWKFVKLQSTSKHFWKKVLDYRESSVDMGSYCASFS